MTKGFALIEIVVGTAIISLSLWALATVALYTHTIVKASNERLRAASLATEGAEAVRNIRDISWTNGIATLSSGTSYQLAFDVPGERWRATTTSTLIDGAFTRVFTVNNVNRDANDDITSSGGTLDPGTKKLIVTVTWSRGSRSYSEQVSSYIANIFGN